MTPSTPQLTRRGALEAEDLKQMSNLLNIKQLAEKLNMSEKTLYNYVADQKIPYVKISNLVRFDPQEIESWIKKRSVKPLAVWY